MRVSKKSVLQELTTSLLRMYISVRSLRVCPACFEFLSSKMARRRDSSIFSSGKTHSRIPTTFFSSNKRKSEYLNTVLEQSLLLTRWHQKECAHMNKTCTAIENITNDALSRIVKIQTRNSYSLKIKKTLHTWGIFNSRYLMFTLRKDRREDIKTYSSVRDSDVKSSYIAFPLRRSICKTFIN